MRGTPFYLNDKINFTHASAPKGQRASLHLCNLPEFVDKLLFQCQIP